jgi:hypothetical protein
MKTKFIVMAAMAAMFSMGFTACSNNDDELANQQIAEARGIGFNVAGEGNVVTRGYALNAANVGATLPNFQTWAYDAVSGGQYMGVSATVGRTVNNADANSDGVYENSWSYTPVQFWPVNALNFVALAPNAPNGVTGNTVAQDGTSKDITLTTAVTLSTTVSDQDDIMFAEGDGLTAASSTGNVPYTFKHALSQIVFKGKLPTSGAVTKVTIAEITLGNIGKTGNLVFDNNGTFFGGASQITASTPSKFTLSAAELEEDEWDVNGVGANATAGTAFDLTVSNNSTLKNAWMLLPQTAAAWVNSTDAELKAGGLWDAVGSANDEPATGAYLKIRAQLEKDGVVILGSAESDAIYIPLNVSWDRSKKYIYTIEFNGTSALTPITFSVAAQDWTDADPQPGQIDM